MTEHASPVVLVHGAWHGPWCWDRVTPLLDDAGVRWQALDLPTMRDDVGHPTSLNCDAAVLRDVLDALDEPAVVVGHSYGGAVITEGAADHAKVRHLVYLTAFMPAEGGSVQSEAAQQPSQEMAQALRVNAAGRMSLAPEFIGPVLYGDCDQGTVRWASASVRSMQVNFSDGVRAAAWRAIPSTYVVCGQDRVILPELQRAMAKRASRVVEWDTSHSPFASRPELVANLIIDIARAT